MATFIIGVDPGRSTGVAVLREGARFAVFQGSPTAAVTSLSSLLAHLHRSHDEVLIACERYQVGPTAGARTAQSVTHEVIGTVRMLAEVNRYELIIQSPGDAKRLAPNPVLRRLGLYVTKHDVQRPDSHDANDAMRHALLALATRHPVTFERLLVSCGGESSR